MTRTELLRLAEEAAEAQRKATALSDAFVRASTSAHREEFPDEPPFVDPDLLELLAETTTLADRARENALAPLRFVPLFMIALSMPTARRAACLDAIKSGNAKALATCPCPTHTKQREQAAAEIQRAVDASTAAARSAG